MSDKKLNKVYEFFSHNVRTFTTEIVTTIECLKVGFVETESEEFDIVYEAAYLLDLYDIGLNIVFKYLSGDESVNKEKVSVKEITEEFLKSVNGYITSSELNIVKDYQNDTVLTDNFIFKNIYKIILYEFIKLASGALNISLAEKIEISSEKLNDKYPEIFSLFGQILNSVGVKFTMIDNKIILEQLK
ncbi:hypothetical protein DSN97_04375 [Deferribacteraceae bacterium V6Fe1]|nr:hypothetical protein DSN97_04375 [Deferribacteraceae bacterium V6Fe1]